MPEINRVQEPAGDADFQPAAVGDFFYNDGRTYLWVKNTAGVDRLVRVRAAAACNHGFSHDQRLGNAGAPGAELVAAGMLFKSLNFPRHRFGGQVTVEYDDPTGLEIVAVIQSKYEG